MFDPQNAHPGAGSAGKWLYRGDSSMKTPAALTPITAAVALILATAQAAVAQEGAAAAVAQPELSEIEVLARRVNARNRVDAAAPILSYDEAFFQRFEPLSVGDMMKRVPGVSFQSDVGEYAEPSLRGVGSEYTQVLINGRRVTGATNDNTVTVDRIPAELVERVEIIRSPSADIDSQGIGGTLNIILKEGAQMTGGVYRVGGYYNDGETNPSAFVSYGDASENFQWNTSFNYQKRFNRKAATEVERAFDGEGSLEPEFAAVVEDPDERESEDIAWTGDLRGTAGEAGEWFLSGFYMDTDREETEIGREFAAEDDDGEFDSEAEQANQLDAFRETNYGAVTGYESRFGNGHSWSIELGYDETDFEAVETNWVDDLDFDFADVGVTDADSLLAFMEQPDQDIIDLFAAVPNEAEQLRQDEFLDSQEVTDADDAELTLKSSVTYQLSRSKLKLGVEGYDRSRDFSFRAFEVDDGVLEEDDDGLSLFDAKDQRANALIKWTKDFSRSTLEVGGRGEFTHLEIDSTVSEALAEAGDALRPIGIVIVDGQVNVTEDSFEFNPSAHYRWDVAERTQLRLSAARTVRRPSFDQLNPTLLIDDEESILGNPVLDQETALGFDAGIDYDLTGDDAIIGLNFFYRDVSDKIELDGVPEEVNTIFQESVDEDIEASVWVNNPNDGEIWGIEFDLSTPVSFISDDLHVFANYTYIDSEIRDANQNFPIDRPFSLQPDYVYNLGFDHRIGGSGFTWGASYQKLGKAQEWQNVSAEAKEVTDVEYDGNLELFVEKVIAGRFVVRLAAQNLLDAEKNEIQRVYESVEQLQNGTPVTTVGQSEESDPSYILTFRGTF
jgi:outer membrane receptor protein involved in Fe transport